MRLKPSKNTILMLGALCAVIVLAAGAIVYFQNEQLGKLRTQLAGKEHEVQDGRGIAKRRDQAVSELAQDTEQIRFLEEGVSDASYVPTMLQQLEQLAKSTNNKVNSVRPQIVVKAPSKLDQRRDPEAQAKGEQAKGGGDNKKTEKKKEDPYTELNIQISLVGNYASIQAFTDRLMRFPKIMAVEKLNMTPYRGPDVPQNDKTDKLSCEMELTAFIMKQPVAAPPRAGRSATVAMEGSSNG